MSQTSLSLAGFQVILIGRFWVIAEADEERVHAGEFLKLLHYLAPGEAKLYEKGAKEVDGILSEVQKK
jgi:hypothetical protein